MQRLETGTPSRKTSNHELLAQNFLLVDGLNDLDHKQNQNSDEEDVINDSELIQPGGKYFFLNGIRDR